MCIKNHFISGLYGTSLVLLSVMAGFSQETVFAQNTDNFLEYQIKAVFLHNFAKFITWPESAFPEKPGKFYICVIGNDPFGEDLNAAVENKSINNRPVELQRIREIHKAERCHTLFISQSEDKRLSSILAFFKQKPVLTVSDLPEFVERGGMIQFYNVNNKVRFIINLDVLLECSLKADARLLEIAKIFRK